MTQKTNRYGIYEVDHTKFGGVIYSSDFSTMKPNGNFAERIASDLRFDEDCRKNLVTRSRKNYYGG